MGAEEETARTDPLQSGSSARSIPPLVVSLVVDRMMNDRLPLGKLAEEDHWRDAYDTNVTDFSTMCLVHSTWTPIARSALQRRVVVPYYQIHLFLRSPLCGPWISEMIVYWTIDNGYEGATRTDVGLFKALLGCTPQLRSLSFVSSLTSPAFNRNDRLEPPFRVSECLEVISELVPCLENLWMRHINEILMKRKIRTYLPEP